MRVWTFILLTLSLSFAACSERTDDFPAENYRELLMLQVDNVTYAFEGGVRYSFPDGGKMSDSIPLTVDYDAPNDFGNIKLIHAPTEVVVFDGGIVWLGRGVRKIPAQLDQPSQFSSSNVPTPLPDTTHAQVFYGENPPFVALWEAVESLDLVKSFMGHHARVGYFLYTPSVGIGNPDEWDWYILLYR